MFHFVAYIMYYLEIIVYKIPLGEVGLRPSQGLENYILHFCVIWGYRVQHLITQKVYKMET